jgi:hypothetical protein
MEKIPTAKEFIEMNSENHSLIDIEWIMIEFAKLHVEASLKAAVKNVEIKPMEHAGFYMVDSGSILNSYPTENIK